MEKQLGDLNVEISTYGSLPCATSNFTINGIDADKDDFGSMSSDGCPEDCGGYDCHNMHFESNSLQEVRRQIADTKLNFLTDKNIEDIQELLAEELNVGDCGWCV